jgi:hypothetical protein
MTPAKADLLYAYSFFRGSARVEPVVMPPSTRSVWPVT